MSIDDSATYSRRLRQEYGIASGQRTYGDVWVNRWINPYRRAGIQLPDTFAINVANYCMPIIGRKTSDYGFRRYRMHRGVDLKLAIGDTVRAAFAGQVRFTTTNAEDMVTMSSCATPMVSKRSMDISPAFL